MALALSRCASAPCEVSEFNDLEEATRHGESNTMVKARKHATIFMAVVLELVVQYASFSYTLVRVYIPAVSALVW